MIKGRLATLFVLLLAVSVCAQTAVTSSDAAHQQFVFAYRLLQRGELDLAREAFDTYLGKFSNDEKRGDGLYYRALIARKQGANRQAISLLENAPAPRLVPDHALLLLKGQLYSDLNQHDQAIAAMEKIDLTNLEPADKASIYFLRGRAYRALNNLPAAESQLKQVVQLDTPVRAKAMLDLARVQAILKKNDEAVATLEAALATKDPTVAPEAANLAGDLAYDREHYDRAIDFYNVVITNHVSSPQFGPSVVGVLWSKFQQRKYGELLDIFNRHKEALSNIQDRVAAWYLAGAANQQSGRHDQAAELLGRILTGASGSDLEDKVLYRLAASQFELGQYDAMKQTVNRLRRDHSSSPHVPDADFLLASAAARQGDAAGGGAQLTAIVNAGPSHPYYTQALLQRGRLYDDSSLLEPAARDYRTFIEYAKQHPDATDQDTVNTAALRLIDLNYRNGKFDQAAADAKALIDAGNLAPLVEAETLYRLGLAQIKLQQFQPATQTLSTMLDKHPKNPYSAEAMYYRGLLWMAQKQPDKALADLSAAAAVDSLPTNLRVNALRLTAIHQRDRDQRDEAAKTMTNLENIIGVPQLRTDEQLWLARFYTDNGKPRHALKYIEPVLSGGENVTGAQRAEALLLAARGLRDAGDAAAASKAFREVVAIGQGFGFEARLELARTLVMAGDTDDALNEYEGLMSVEEPKTAAEAIFESAHVYRDLARNRKRAGDAAGATEARAEARSRFLRVIVLYNLPELSPLPQLSHINVAELAQADDKKDEVGKQWKELIDNFPDTPYASYAKAMQYAQDGKNNEALHLLRELEKQKIEEPRLAQRVETQKKALQLTP